MSDTDKQIAELEQELRERGVDPPDLRSNNPDPEAREAEQRKALKGFYHQFAEDLMLKLGITKGAPEKTGRKKGGKR